MNTRTYSTADPQLTRRGLLRGVMAAGVSSIALAGAEGGKAVSKGRIKQSICFWCFNSAGEKWDIEKTCQVAKELGLPSVEFADVKDWGVLKKYGLICACAHNGMAAPPFVKGLNNVKYHEEVVGRTKQSIDNCAEAGFPSVIGFTGYKWRDAENPKSGEISLEEGAENCVKALKELARHAEKKGVNVCIEHLNTRDDSHPMKGHPGYQGEDLDYVAGIIRRVGSPRIKLLFDIYHVQIMHGDVIRRIEQNKDIIGHIHTAGNPGRGELDDTQEIHYAPIMKKLVEIKFTGYVGQEFIPTRNPLEGLTEAVKLCDV